MARTHRVLAISFMTVLGLPQHVWAGSTGRAAVCKVGSVELIVGGQDTGRECSSPVAWRPARAASGLTSASTGTAVSVGIQQTRDQERRRILADELAHEQEALELLRRQGPAREATAWTRTQENIAALNRELTRMPTSP